MTTDWTQEIEAAGSDSATPRPIGVPFGYQPPRPVVAGPPAPAGTPNTGYGMPRGARPNPYMTGDEWRPASQPPEVIAGIQARLEASGLLRAYRVGVWDNTTRSAYKRLLEYANGLGVDDGTALEQYQSSGMGQIEGTEPERAPLVTRVSSPDEIRRALNTTFREALGSGIRADDPAIERMVAAFHAQEKAYDEQVYAAQETGGTVVAPPSIETFAEMEAKKADPVAFDSYKVLDKFSQVLETFGGQR